VIPTDVIIGMFMNNRVAPFNDAGVRRALNYAVDRAKLATLLGQDSRPSCQALPPFIPGYRPYCPYTLDPNSAGKWIAPDFTRAQVLIAASGTRGTPITIWSPQFLSQADFTTTGRYLASLLDRLGYPTQIKTFTATHSAAFYRFSDSRLKVQAALLVGIATYPSAAEFLGPEFTSCQAFQPNSINNQNFWGFCDPQFDATVRSALAAEVAGAPTATALWAKADRQFTNQAPGVTP
jgi:peptide/nickel transport system substrate-binding protein